MNKKEESKMKKGGVVEKMSKVSPSQAKVLPDNKMKYGGKAKKK